jgi:GTPase
MRTISSQGKSSVPARVHRLYPCLLSGIRGELCCKYPEYVTLQKISPLYIDRRGCYNYPTMTRSGFVAISGQPNVGKSTLINGFLGEKIAITSPRPETTRDTIRGIYSEGETQIIFVDTPGIHKPHDLLGRMMLSRAESCLMESDIILFVTEKHTAFNKNDENIRDRLPHPKEGKKVIFVINKVDRVKDKKILLPMIEKAMNFYPFNEVVPVCALKDDHVKKLLDIVKSYLPEGPFLYPEDQLTDKTENFMIQEIIREKVLEHTFEEVPHSVAVVIDDIEDDGDDSMLNIYATIYVERNSQKSILIGKGGNMMKRIGEKARGDIQKLVDRRVYLTLWVKVCEKWKKDPTALKEMGYSDE